MSILRIMLYPASVLHQVAEPVDNLDARIHRLLDDMAETMYAAPGVGLAAPQVNVSKRVIVIDVETGREGGKGKRKLFEMINPVITHRSGEIEWEEGCLSIPFFNIIMKRAAAICCTFLDRYGKEQTLDAEDLLAVAIQHEIDHLDGKLIIDTIGRVQQDFYLSKLKKGKLGKPKGGL